MENPKILVVEDHPLNMKLVRSLLQLSGYQVLEAKNAETAIQMAISHLPDLILMDIQLPGMDGLEATRIIKCRKESENIPVIALTSYAMPGDEEKARESFCSGYITKPIDTRKFIGTIQQYLDPRPVLKEPESAKGSSSKPRILIVDDDPLNIKLLAAKLPADQFETLTASNGQMAIQKVLRDVPDLVLLDIMMPGMDGFSISRWIKGNPATEEIPIILITALEGLENKIKGLEAGADEFLNKPVNSIELLARINSLLRLKQYRERLFLRHQSEQSFLGPGPGQEKGGAVLPLQKLLLVDDNEKDLQILRSCLAGDPYKIEQVNTGEAALDRIQKEPFDLILLDVLLPGIDGFEVCRQLKGMKQTREVQVILITCLSELENKIKGIELGADDYLMKPINARELKARVKVLLNKKKCLDELRTDFEKTLNLSINDGLTGLYNQTYFKKFIEQELKRATRQKYPVSLIILDIDNFKQINDSLGHPAGDQILSELGSLIKKNIREIDFPARYGGDEFVVVLPYSSKEETISIARRLMKSVESRPDRQEDLTNQGKLTLSMGIAFFPQQGTTMTELIRNADLALYQAKRLGKNSYCIYEGDCSQEQDRISEKATIEMESRNSLAREGR
jgi:two-component system cell cycle response regulator